MNHTPLCPHCHQALPPGTPVGQCPHCLLQAAADSSPRRSRFQALAPAELDRLLPEFEVLSLIGVGGMGAVYKAIHRRLDRVVALKLLPRELAQADPTFGERFLREARSLAKLQHPNLVTVYDCGEVDGLCFIVMEYVEGENLRQRMARGRLQPAECLDMMRQLCAGLSYAHRQGLVHRDIKPENILIDGEGEVHLADFGLARLMGEADATVSLTASAQALGTPHYMAPEQLQSPDLVDHRADLFALGVVFYEMLTGHLPQGRFPLPSAESQVSPAVDAAVLRSLEPDPSRRYQGAEEFGADLKDGGQPPRQAPPAADPPTEAVPSDEHRPLVQRALTFAVIAFFCTFFTWGHIGMAGFDLPWKLSSGTISVFLLELPLWIFPVLIGLLVVALGINLAQGLRMPWKLLSRSTLAAFLFILIGTGGAIWGSHSGSMEFSTPLGDMSNLLEAAPTMAGDRFSLGAGSVLTLLMLFLTWLPLHHLARRQRP